MDIWTTLKAQDHPLIKDHQRLKEIYAQEGLIPLLNALGNVQDFYEYKLNNKERTNFDQLFSIALRFNQQANSLAKFIYEIEHGSQAKTKEVTSVALDEDVVRAITIHQSKGLQYKTVFIWSTSQAKNQDSNNEHLIDTDLGLALKPLKLPQRIRQTTIEYLVIAEKINKEELEENTRLLYVATTRAQQRMYFVDVVKDPNYPKINYEILSERKGITGTILASVHDNPYIQIKGDDTVDMSFETSPIAHHAYQKIEHYQKQDIKALNIISPSNAHEDGLLTIKAHGDHFKHGTTIHEVLEQLPFKTWTKDDLKPYDLSSKDIQHLLTFNRSAIFQKVYDHQAYREYPFIMKDQQQIINGTMDLVLIDDKEVIIIDYKTNRQTTKDELIKLYRSQLDTYAKIMQRYYPKHHIYKYIYAFELDEAILL